MKRTLGHYRLWVNVLEVLLAGPVTLYDLAERANVSYDSIRNLMKQLRKGGVVHISGWKKDGYNRYNFALYKLGHGVDAIKPTKTEAQRSRDYRLKKLKAKEDKLFRPVSETLVRNPTIDHALRSWI